MFELKKEILETHEALLTVEVEEKTVEKAMRQAARSISHQVSIPGFRRGKAPYRKVVQYVGEAPILQEAADKLLQDIYPQIIEQAEIEPYDSGELLDMKPAPLTFEIRVPLAPMVELGDYHALRRDWEDVTVSEDELATVLEQIREENTMLEPLERPAAYGDEVHIDVLGTSEGDVIVDEEEIEVLLSEETPFLAPGFVDALVGLSTGEEKSFTLTLPEDIEEESLQGADVDFEIEVVGVYERQLPELDDALASTVGAFETLDELKQDIHKRLLDHKLSQHEQTYREEMIQALVDQAEIHYPPPMVERMMDDMLEDVKARMQREHKISLEDALRLSGKTVDQYREELRPQAEQRIQQSLALGQFGQQEDIQVEDEDVLQSYTDLLVQAGLEDAPGMEDMQLDSALGQSLRANAYDQKVLAHLEQIGRGEVDVTAPVAFEESEEPDASDSDNETSTAESEPALASEAGETVGDEVVSEPASEESEAPAADPMSEAEAEETANAPVSTEETTGDSTAADGPEVEPA